MNVDPSNEPPAPLPRVSHPPLIPSRASPYAARGARRRSPVWFTAIVLTLTFVSVAVAGVPGLAEMLGLRSLSTRPISNESVTIAILKHVSSAQSQLQASGGIDMDGDGNGEFGFFAELAGVVPLRGSDATCEPQLLSSRFGNVQRGRVQCSGYWLQIFLPYGPDAWIGEHHNRHGTARVNPVRAEEEWLCYAWPVAPGRSGSRAFLITHEGSLLATPFEEDAQVVPGRFGFRRVGCHFRPAYNQVDELGFAWRLLD